MLLDDYKKELGARGEVYLRVKVRPAMGKSETAGSLIDENGETIKINIAAAPVKGRANQELVKFLSKEFNVLKNNVKIISGGNDKVKLVKLVR